MRGQEQKDARKGGKVVPALCNVFGAVIIVLGVALCAPIALAPALGMQVMHVASASMEPAIPVGSAVFTRMVEPAHLQVGDVVVFQTAGSGPVAHRVQLNRMSLGEVVTKGDANGEEDVEPVSYDAVLGRVELHVPMLGSFLEIYDKPIGKVYLALALACGIMLNVLASRMRQAHRREAGGEGDARVADDAMNPSRRDAHQGVRSSKTPVAVAAVLAGVVFLGSAGVVGYVLAQYGAADSAYDDASQDYTAPTPVEEVPKAVDFEGLRAQGPDVVGWLYCEGTPIDYPVVQGSDNERYLHEDYSGQPSVNGSIFVDCDNAPGFGDANTILYGHHMNSGAMFAGLDSWSDQAYFDEHPTMWLLTPEQAYRIQLFSAHHTYAGSSMYEILHEGGARFQTFLAQAKGASDIMSGVNVGAGARCVMLSTCDYLYEDDRYVLHGVLVPV